MLFLPYFNVWQEDDDSNQAGWQEIQSVQLDELLSVFRSHESIPGRPSGPQYMLDQIREYMRHRLARMSASFRFGECALTVGLLFNVQHSHDIF